MIRKHDPVRLWVIALLVMMLSVLAYGVALLNQNIDGTQRAATSAAQAAQAAADISAQNNRFVDNFSNYMNCLIIGEDEVVLAVGEERYVEICKQLLYRGLPDIPPTIKAEIPPEYLTTTTTVPPAP